MSTPPSSSPTQTPPATDATATPPTPQEYGGRKKGLEPTRYHNDWEKDGRAIDFS